MGLVAWYPLNGDTLDHSGNGNDATNIGATINTSGKIGQCYSFDGSSNYMQTPYGEVLKVQSSTFAMWINAIDLDAYRGLMELVSPGGTRYGRFMSFGSNQIRYHVSYNDYVNTYASFPNVPLNQWVHLTGTYDGGFIRTYMNGTKVGEVPFNFPIPYINEVCLKIGLDPGRYFNGRINDVRIYDHTLSDKEVYELSKAKVLHYNSEGFMEPTENLVRNGDFRNGYSNWSNWGSPPIREIVPSGEGNNALHLSISASNQGVIQNIPVIGGKTYSISYRAWVILGTCGIQLSLTGSGMTTTWHAAYQPANQSYQDFQVLKSVPEGYTSLAIQVGRGALSSPPVELYITNIQVEQKDYSTPFVDGVRDGVARDCTEYKNDAPLSLSTSPSWSANSKIGTGCYVFNAVDSRLQLPSSIPVINEEFTATMWVYYNTHKNFTALFGSRNGMSDGTMLFTNAGGTVQFDWGANGSQYRWNTEYSIPTDIWVQVTIVCNSSGRYLYINGVLRSSTDVSGMKPIMDLPFRIGGDTHIDGYTLDGKLADFRIYATALSDTDILSLYKARVTLDNKGNMYSQSLRETISSKVEVRDTGTLICNEINEVGPTNGLVGWWKLGDNAKDYSGYGNHGTITNAPSVSVSPKGDKAFTMTGADSGADPLANRINIPISGVDFSNGITFTGWVYKSSADSTHRAVLSTNDGGSLYWEVSSQLTFRLAGVDINYYGWSTMPYGQWNFFCAMYDPATGTMSTWLNGVKVREHSGKTGVPNITTINLGSMWDGGRSIRGNIYDFRLYNRPLTPEEVSILYKQISSPAQMSNQGIMYLKGQIMEN